MATLALVGVFFVPAHASSSPLVVGAYGSASVDLNFPGPGWVTVRFAHGPGPGMTDWMAGPHGDMFHHSMMHGGDSYGFWTWGGTYRCGIENPSSTGMSGWVNATWSVF